MAEPTERGEPVKRTGKGSSKETPSDSRRSAGDGAQKISPGGKAADSVHKEIRWTIMLYIAADGGIANFGIESLKQLNRSVAMAAGPQDKATVVVAAQFAIDAPGGQQIPRYIFNQLSGGSLGNSFAGFLNAPDNMTEQQALISFLKWVYSCSACEADKYALILWGHGPEFLLQPPAADPTNTHADLYLSPEELREALDECVPKDNKLSIVGFDACSMNMFEMAYEIREFAEYMVASQQEVPDLSFPYDSLVMLFRGLGADVEQLLKESVYAYVEAYQDYVTTPTTGMKRATLSALRLSRCGDLKNAVGHLASALLNAKDERGLPTLLLKARNCSRDYAGGLYVDLVDFSMNLISVLSVSKSETVLNAYVLGVAAVGGNQALLRTRYSAIIAACNDVVAALVEDSDKAHPNHNLLLLANCSADSSSHGTSLYFPYFSDTQNEVAIQPMVKGGTGTLGGKEFSAVLNHAGSGLLMCARREMIVDTEGYYEDLKLALDTAWYRFIVEQWSHILAQAAPEDLDVLYSAQQCAVNLGRSRLMVNSPCPPKKSP
jgi:Clostripain family